MTQMIENPDLVTVPPQISHYKFQELIGYGSFAVVRVAVDLNTQQRLACKIVPLSKLSTAELQERFETEIRVLQQMRHPNITQLYNLEKDDNNYYIFMELCEGGELLQYIVSKKRLEEVEAKCLFKQISDALRYVHSLGAVHRDLKPENILFSSQGHIKITDFGFSRYVGEKGLVSTSCGTPCYASPECLAGEQYDGAKSDIWSAGVILFAMVTGTLPWTKTNQTQLYKQIQSCEFTIPDFISPDLKDLIHNTICLNPTNRYTASQCLSHSWLADATSISDDPADLPSVSLKKVDKVFMRDCSQPILLEANSCRNSLGKIDFINLTKMLKDKERKPLPRLEVKSASNVPTRPKIMTQTLMNRVSSNQRTLPHVIAQRPKVTKKTMKTRQSAF